MLRKLLDLVISMIPGKVSRTDTKVRCFCCGQQVGINSTGHMVEHLQPDWIVGTIYEINDGSCYASGLEPRAYCVDCDKFQSMDMVTGAVQRHLHNPSNARLCSPQTPNSMTVTDLEGVRL